MQELTPAEAVQAYGAQPIQTGAGVRHEYPRRPSENGADPHAGSEDDETDLQGIDMDDVPAGLRPAFIHLVDEIGHLREHLDEARHQIDYLKDRTDHDPVTGCLTRRAFQGTLEQVLTLDKENDIHSSLGLIALPDWGELRRTTGLEAAEAYAIEACDICERHMRTGDRIARIDDNTFALLMVASGRDEATLLLGDIQQELRNMTVAGGMARIIVTQMELSEGGAQENLARADRALIAQWARQV